MNAKSALTTVALVPWSLVPRPDTRHPIPQTPHPTPHTQHPITRPAPGHGKGANPPQTKMLRALTNLPLTPLFSAVWIHNPYPLPLLWKTGCKNYKQLKINHLQSHKSRKWVPEMAKNGPKTVIFHQKTATLSQNQPIFALSLFTVPRLSALCELRTVNCLFNPWTLDPEPWPLAFSARSAAPVPSRRRRS